MMALLPGCSNVVLYTRKQVKQFHLFISGIHQFINIQVKTKPTSTTFQNKYVFKLGSKYVILWYLYLKTEVDSSQ